MVNPGGRVFVEREGIVAEVSQVPIAEKNLQVAVRNIARLLGECERFVQRYRLHVDVASCQSLVDT